MQSLYAAASLQHMQSVSDESADLHLAAQQRAGTLQQEQARLKEKLRQSESKAEQAQASVQQSQAELQALSQAYADLEAHAFSLEGQLNNLQSSSAISTHSGELLAIASLHFAITKASKVRFCKLLKAFALNCYNAETIAFGLSSQWAQKLAARDQHSLKFT